MKKFNNLLLVITLVFVTLISCREDSINKENFSQVPISTSVLSKGFINLGAKSIDVKGNILKVITFKNFKLSGETVNLSDYEFTYDSNILSFKNDNSYKIYVDANKIFVETPEYNGELPKMNGKLFANDQKLKMLVIFTTEIMQDKSKKISFEDFSKEQIASKVGSCSMWNTVYSVGIGLNGSAAWADYHFHQTNDITSNQLDGCSPIGNPSLDSFSNVYYVTRAWCCG